MKFCEKTITWIDKQNIDLGECTRDLIPVSFVFASVCLLTLFSLLRNQNKRKNSQENFSVYDKMIWILLVPLAGFSSAFYVFKIVRKPVVLSLILTLILNTISHAAMMCIAVFEMKKDVFWPSFSLFMFSLLELLKSSWALKGSIQGSNKVEIVLISFFLLFCFSEFVLLGSLPRRIPEGTYNQTQTEKIVTEEEVKQSLKKEKENRSPLFSTLTFHWMNFLLYRGYKREIRDEDFFKIGESMKTKNLHEKFRGHLKEKDKQHMTKRRFVFLLFKAFGAEFYLAIFLKFLNDILIFVNPFLMQYFIKFFNNNGMRDVIGYSIAVLMFSSNILLSFVLNHYFDNGFRIAVKLKAFLMDYLFKKSLRLAKTGEGKRQTTGEIVNLMSADTQSFLELLPLLNIIWSGPLQIFIGVLLLYMQIGVASFVGLGVMLLLMIPGNTFIVRRMKSFKKKLMIEKDKRIKITNEVLGSMKVIKLYAWEKGFREKINSIREKELKYLRKIAFLNCCNIFFWNATTIFVSLGSFVYYTQMGNVLTSSKAFTSLFLLSIIRFPLGMFPTVINSSINVYISLKRCVSFLNETEIAPLLKNKNKDKIGSEAIAVSKASFYWDEDKTKSAFNLTKENREFSVSEKELVMIIGKVGSGKSAFLTAILGELFQKEGDSNVSEDIAYVSQSAWIQNATIRDNILFGNGFDKEKYEKVIKACCLIEDFSIIKGGDMAEIGERGINLSGGQKQRVALARAVYTDKKVYLIDDVMSALDPEVSNKIMKRCILGLLKDKAIVFSTNSVHFLKHASKIAIIKNGTIYNQGSFEELNKTENLAALVSKTKTKKSEEGKEEMREEIDLSFSSTQEHLSREISVYSDSKDSDINQQGGFGEGEKIITEEKKEVGKVKWKVYKNYFFSFGGLVFFLFVILTYALKQAGIYGTNRYVSFWSKKYDENGKLPEKDVVKYILYYAAVSSGAALLVFLNALLHSIGQIIASKRVSGKLLDSVLSSPMSFFDTTPRGRIVNRFSSDVLNLDQSIPTSSFHFFTCFFEVLTILIVISMATPWFLIAIVPLFIVYYLIQVFFIKPSREMKRISSIRLSPVYSRFQETIDGTITIRAFREQKRFVKECEDRIDHWTGPQYFNFIANRWLSLRLEVLGSAVILVSTCLMIFQRKTLEAGIAGLTLIYSMRFVAALNWMVRSAVMLESQIISVERIEEYTALEPEEIGFFSENRNEEINGKDNWPSEGEIVVSNLSMKYRPELDLVLRNVSFKVFPNEKVGIVGRTGSGKSSLFNCIFRINEARSGSIFIDKVDIKCLHLSNLRSNLTIIPQDPVLFIGSIRFNLDPMGTKTDSEIWNALSLCNVKETVENLKNEKDGKCGLDFEVLEGGSNLSGGERQLLCISRALLRRSKVLLLDEATSSIDVATDEKIQATIRDAFQNFTVLTIAHRLNTVMGSDKIIVMDSGSVVEVGKPKDLMEDTSSRFFNIVKEGIS